MLRVKGINRPRARWKGSVRIIGHPSKFYLSDEWKKASAKKRGGKAMHLSIDAEEAESIIAGVLTDRLAGGPLRSVVCMSSTP